MIIKNAELLSFHVDDIDTFVYGSIKDSLTREQQSLWSESVAQKLVGKARLEANKFLTKREAEAEKIRDESIRKNIGMMVTSLVQTHRTTLIVKRRLAVSSDGYGNINTDKWHREVEYFIDAVVLPALADSERGLWTQAWRDSAFDYIEQVVAHEGDRLAQEFREDMAPAEFEIYCCKLLSSLGWDADRTGGVGDQGADVVARRNGKVVVLQCKKHSAPVGNEAVQQAHAAKSFYSADAAAVVTNSQFTKSAIELAAAVDVRLLHYTALREIFRSPLA